MNPADDDVTCQLCGARYTQHDGLACRAGCPLHRDCGLLKCPRCGYETPPPTRLTRWLSRWMERRTP